MSEHWEVVWKLLRNGASGDGTDLAGWTALSYACQYNDLPVIEALLVDYHAKKTGVTPDGTTILSIACQTGNLNVIGHIWNGSVDGASNSLSVVL